MTPRPWGGPRFAALLDTVLVLGLAAYSVAGAAVPLPGETGEVTGAWPAAVAGTAALVLLARRRAPTAVLLAVLGLCLYAGVAGHQMGSTPVALLLASHATGRWAPRPWAMASLAVLCTALGGAAVAGAAGLSGQSATWALPLVFAAPWGIGWWGRAREEQHGEALRRAAEEERLRIARELHDVVTHALTGIAVQAGVARHIGSGQDAALEAVETTSREALADLRRMVAVLRDPTSPETPWLAAPGAEEVSRLGSEHAEVHGPVVVCVDPAFDGLPSSLRLAAFRLVQESLTNVARHAAGAAASVSVDVQDGTVVVAVRDDGEAVSGGPPGHGLVGMRERVLAFGGTLAAGPRDGGGFEVRAQLPAVRGA